MLNLKGGLYVGWYQLLYKSAVYKADEAGKAALKFGSVYVPSLNSTANAPENEWLEDDISSWVSAYF